MTKVKSATPREKLWNRDFILTMAVSSAAALANGMFSPALPIYAETLGITTDIIGTIISVSLFICMFGRMVIGGMSARHSRKKLVTFTLVFLLLAYSGFFFAKNIYILAAAKIFQAIASGMTITVLSTLSIEYIPESRMGEGIGIYSMAASLAQCVAPLLGTLLAKNSSFSLLFGLSTAATAASVAILLFVRDKAPVGVLKRKRKISILDYLYPPAFMSAVMLMFNGITFSAISNFISIFGLSVGVAGIGMFFTIQSVVIILIRPVCGKLSDKKSPAVLLVPGLLFSTAACVVIANAASIAVFCVAAVMYGIGFGSSQATIQLMAIKSAPPEKRGVANGTFYVGGDIGLSLGSALAGVLAFRVGYRNMYMVMGAISLISVVLFAVYSRINARKHEANR